MELGISNACNCFAMAGSLVFRYFMNNTYAIDFFTVPTANFKILYVFVILLHERRKVVHFNVTLNPTAQWTAQQIVDACPWDTKPKYLLRDRGCLILGPINPDLAGGSENLKIAKSV
jgi:hypothetical protein